MNETLDLYTNSLRIVSGLYEVAIRLMVNTLDDEGNIEAREVAWVRMSPQQAMALKILLEKHLDAYGDQFHEIFLPEELVNRLSGATSDTDEGKDDLRRDANDSH